METFDFDGVTSDGKKPADKALLDDLATKFLDDKTGNDILRNMIFIDLYELYEANFPGDRLIGEIKNAGNLKFGNDQRLIVAGDVPMWHKSCQDFGRRLASDKL